MSAYEKVIKAIYDNLGYTVDDELMNILTCEDQHILVQAPAGGTKTTLSQAFVVKEKVKKMIMASKANLSNPFSESTSYNIENIMCCVYNNHNVSDIKAIHRRVYGACEMLGLITKDPTSQRYATSEIYACTLHSFVYSAIGDHKEFFRLREVKKAKDSLVRFQLEAAAKKILGQPVKDIRPYRQLYELYTNLMLFETEDFSNTAFKIALAKTDVQAERIGDIFKLFDQQKALFKTYEYSDWLKMALKLLEVPEILEYYQDRFKIIVADEVQDFTTLMFKIYSKLVSDKTRTLAIGDSDQTLYTFNGASPNNIDRYEELTGLNVTKFNLTLNRRCREKTFHFADNIINTVSGRVPRAIKTIKEGGRFVVMTYSSFEDETDNLISEIQSVPYNTTAVLFRRQSDALMLSRRLYEMGTGVSYINAMPFNKHTLYRMFMETINSVFLLRTRDTWKDLYKILPFNKDKLSKFFQFDQHEMPTVLEDIQDWCYIDFTPLLKNSTLGNSVYSQILFAQGVAENVKSLPTREYIREVFDLFYWNYFQHIAEEDDVFLTEVIVWLLKDLTSVNTLTKVLEGNNRLESKISYSMNYPITISTIHGAKGLEFDRVILAHMESDIKSNGSASADEQQYNLDDETRVYYVGATRQRDCLVISYNENRPHVLCQPQYLTPPDKIEVNENFDPIEKNIASALFNKGQSGIKRRFALS